MANYKAIQETIDMFDAMDKDTRFDMDKWVHTCGAPSCVAGYVVSNRLPQLYSDFNAIYRADQAFIALHDQGMISEEVSDRLAEQLENLAKTRLGADDLGDADDIFPTKATEIFGISDYYATGIFYPEGRYWDGLNGTKPKHAVKALKRLLKDLRENGVQDEQTNVTDGPNESGMSLV
jgi:hypothetical protein